MTANDNYGDDHDHGHGHGHGTHDHDGHYVGNFDEAAKTWDDDPSKVERARKVAQLIVKALNPGPDTEVFEYGSGTGLVSEALAPFVGPITLSDPSEGMRSAIANKITRGTLPSTSRIWTTDLDSEPAPPETFDLVVAVQVLHHVGDLNKVLNSFATLTKAGAHLAICDLEAEDGSFHGEGFGGHHGFHRSELAEHLRSAGFARVSFEHAYDIERDGRSYPLFLAIATR